LMSCYYHKLHFLPSRLLTKSPHCQLFNNSIIHTNNINVTSKPNFLLHKSTSFSPYQCHWTFSFTLTFILQDNYSLEKPDRNCCWILQFSALIWFSNQKTPSSEIPPIIHTHTLW
jgi:hypothetical protein